ncbi:hypothetical protein [Actinomyces sp. oral taxon 170]|uniref:hypothetical protein n=1 Tax=Actinomyces sp. oral taxon 170 TaxID=712117 RepID=UPI0005530053|nr:hypothetical protein [Actinomyces sp. oral taxon 170]
MKTSVTATAAATAAMAALAVSACGQNGSSDSGTASAAASASQPSTSRGSGAASSDGMMTLLPTGNLVIQVPGDAVTGATTTYDDGMQQTYYDSRGGSPLTVAVEYYAAGVKPAASVLATEQQSLTAQSIQPTVTPTEVPGGTGGNRLDWQTTAIPPWLQDRKTAEVPITCAGVIVDGPSGDSYGVYVFADPKNQESLERMSSVLSSVAVNAS